jgi:hypothetical protein
LARIVPTATGATTPARRARSITRTQYASSLFGRDGWPGLSLLQNRAGHSPPATVFQNDQTFRRGWCSKRYG